MWRKMNATDAALEQKTRFKQSLELMCVFDVLCLMFLRELQMGARLSGVNCSSASASPPPISSKKSRGSNSLFFRNIRARTCWIPKGRWSSSLRVMRFCQESPSASMKRRHDRSVVFQSRDRLVKFLNTANIWPMIRLNGTLPPGRQKHSLSLLRSGERWPSTFSNLTESTRAKGCLSCFSFPMRPQLVKDSFKRQSRNDKMMSSVHSAPAVTLQRNRSTSWCLTWQ